MDSSKGNSSEGQVDSNLGNALAAPTAELKRGSALRISLDSGMHVEKAIKILKRALIREGSFKEWKLRKYHEKPCERRKRKQKESVKRMRKEEARNKKNPFSFT